MQLENSFEVPAEVERVWPYLLDVEKVIPCMPGAQLTETIDDRHWKGKIVVKIGPVSLTFAGKVEMVERDDEAHRVVLKASGMEQRGKGAASATVTTTAEQRGGVTHVAVVQDLTVQGQAAQMSRGMMKDVSGRLMERFADCLRDNFEAEQQAVSEAPVATGTAAPSEAAVSAGAHPSGAHPSGAHPSGAHPSGAAASAMEPEAVASAPEPGAPASPTTSPRVPPAGRAAPSASSPRPAPRTAAPVGGVRLMLSALGGALVRGLKRLFGGSRFGG